MVARPRICWSERLRLALTPETGDYNPGLLNQDEDVHSQLVSHALFVGPY